MGRRAHVCCHRCTDHHSFIVALSFGRVEHTVRSLVDEHYPVVELSRELAQVAGATVAMAPKLAEVGVDDVSAL